MPKSNRLPPQPTDTALARLVQRLVDRVPAVSIGRHRATVERMAKAQQQVVRLTHSNEGLRDENDLLYRDIQKMTARPLPSHWDVRYQAIPDRPVKEHRVSVRFLPWHYAWTDDPTVPRSEISNFTIHAIRNAARTLAQHHADEVERKIFDITMQQRTKEGHDGR